MSQIEFARLEADGQYKLDIEAARDAAKQGDRLAMVIVKSFEMGYLIELPEIHVLFIHETPIAVSLQPFALPSYGDKTAMKQIKYGGKRAVPTRTDERTLFESRMREKFLHFCGETDAAGNYVDAGSWSAWEGWKAKGELL